MPGSEHIDLSAFNVDYQLNTAFASATSSAITIHIWRCNKCMVLHFNLKKNPATKPHSSMLNYCTICFSLSLAHFLFVFCATRATRHTDAQQPQQTHRSLRSAPQHAPHIRLLCICLFLGITAVLCCLARSCLLACARLSRSIPGVDFLNVVTLRMSRFLCVFNSHTRTRECSIIIRQIFAHHFFSVGMCVGLLCFTKLRALAEGRTKRTFFFEETGGACCALLRNITRVSR